MVDVGTWPPRERPASLVRPEDHGLIAWSMDPAMIATGTSPASGTLVGAKITIPKAATISRAAHYLNAAGGTLTSGQNFVALYDNSNKLLTVSADMTTAWAGTGAVTATFAAPQTVEAGTILKVCWWSVGTTPPQFGRANSYGGGAPNLGLVAPNFRFFTADTGLTTTAPATLATQSAGGIGWLVALS